MCLKLNTYLTFFEENEQLHCSKEHEVSHEFFLLSKTTDITDITGLHLQ